MPVTRAWTMRTRKDAYRARKPALGKVRIRTREGAYHAFPKAVATPLCGPPSASIVHCRLGGASYISNSSAKRLANRISFVQQKSLSNSPDVVKSSAREIKLQGYDLEFRSTSAAGLLPVTTDCRMLACVVFCSMPQTWVRCRIARRTAVNKQPPLTSRSIFGRLVLHATGVRSEA